MSEIKIIAVRCRERPKYESHAIELLAEARKFYQDPENEKAFREWLAERKGKHDRVDDRRVCGGRGRGAGNGRADLRAV